MDAGGSDSIRAMRYASTNPDIDASVFDDFRPHNRAEIDWWRDRLDLLPAGDPSRPAVLAILAMLNSRCPVSLPPVDIAPDSSDVLAWATDAEAARLLADGAIDGLDPSHDVDVRVAAHLAWREVHRNPDFAQERIASVTARGRARDAALRLAAAHRAVIDMLETGHVVRADAAMAEIAGLVLGGPPRAAWVHAVLSCMRAGAAGDVAEAARWSREAERVGIEADIPGATLVRLENRGVLSLLDPGLEDAFSDIGDLLWRNQASVVHPPAAASACYTFSSLGQFIRARHMLDLPLAALSEDTDRESSWLLTLAAVADTVADLHNTEFAMEEVIDPLIALAMPYARLVSMEGVGGYTHGCLARPLARLLAIAGRQAEAERMFAVAEEVHRRVGFTRWRLQGSLDRAALFECLSIPEDEARFTASQVARSAGELGLVSMGRTANRLARSLAGDLTERQRAVLAMLAEGLLVREIADRLTYSHATIRHETLRIYAILGVRDRDAAVEVARQRGLLA